MRVLIAAAAIVTVTILIERPSLAADLPASVVAVAPAPAYVRVSPPIRYRSYRATAYRTIGMPCVMRPHVVVRLNWNGPQCRWIDNVIPFDRPLRRYRVVVRTY